MKITKALFLLPFILSLSGCISSSNPSPPERTTIVVPNGATVTCRDGTSPPCP